jgi:hypothetical protein
MVSRCEPGRRPEKKVSLGLPLQALLTVGIGSSTAAHTDGQRPAMQRLSLDFMFTSQLKEPWHACMGLVTDRSLNNWTFEIAFHRG